MGSICDMVLHQCQKVILVGRDVCGKGAKGIVIGNQYLGVSVFVVQLCSLGARTAECTFVQNIHHIWQLLQ